MSIITSQSATVPTIVTKGDRARITTSVLTTALLHEAGAQLTNTAIARLVGASVYQVATVRKLLASMGTLGTITDRPLPDLPLIPSTTWSEFHSALFDANDLCAIAEEENIVVESLGKLKALIDVGDALRKTTGMSLSTVIDITKSLRHATLYASDDVEEARPPLTDQQIAEIEAGAWNRPQVASTTASHI